MKAGQTCHSLSLLEITAEICSKISSKAFEFGSTHLIEALSDVSFQHHVDKGAPTKKEVETLVDREEIVNFDRVVTRIRMRRCRLLKRDCSTHLDSWAEGKAKMVKVKLVRIKICK